MGDYLFDNKNRTRVEQLLLGVYTLYSLTIILLIFEDEGNHFTGYFVLIGLFLCYLMHITKFRTYRFRAIVSTIIMQIGIVLYSGHLGELSRVLPIFLISVVLVGLYGIAEIISITAVSTGVLLIYHAFIVKTIPFEVSGALGNALSQIANVFFMQYVVYIWTKRISEGSEQLMQTIEELREVQNSKDDFLANVSHEIRTPINTICGMSEIALKEELSDKVRNCITDIDMAGRGLMSVVRDILDFSELMSGNIALEEESYNITSTINDVINMAMAKRGDKHIEIIVDCDADIPCLLSGDEKKLRRIIMNLMDNALKFTNNGCITLGVHHRRESYGLNLIVSIKDTGIGISPENLERISSSFTQVETGRNRSEEGLGLGLSISAALIQKMGGALTMKSKLGKGTTVQFTVPQGILVDQPVVELKDKGTLNIACYIDMEQFRMAEIRDEYASVIHSMTEGLKEHYHICDSFMELTRRHEKEPFTHVFTSIVEYVANTSYYDELAKKINVVVILDTRDEQYVTNPHIIKLYKPFYILSIAAIMNGVEEASEKKIAPSKFRAEGSRVLVVDDNRMNLRVVEGLLGDYGIRVMTAESGAEAIQKILSSDYDFVFMDHMMPEMDGVETMKRIRQLNGTYFQRVPIVALTANAVAGTREHLLAEGFNDFLEKPVERSVLERVLKRNLIPEKIVFIEDEQTAQEEESEEARGDKERLHQNLAKIGIDAKKGIFYCNGQDKFYNMLRSFEEVYTETSGYVAKMFLKEEWKNYTIAVHGIKGAMASIGAVGLSELAKSLEMAGKENRIEFIKEHHSVLMTEYQKLLNGVNDCLEILDGPKKELVKEKISLESLQEMTEDLFNSWTDALEDAAYSLEADRMNELLDELSGYSYQGSVLSEMMSPVRKKIEMSDLISAAELAVRIKTELQEKKE